MKALPAAAALAASALLAACTSIPTFGPPPDFGENKVLRPGAITSIERVAAPAGRPARLASNPSRAGYADRLGERIVVRLDDGTSVTVTQESADGLHVGDPVYVEGDSIDPRVAPR